MKNARAKTKCMQHFVQNNIMRNTVFESRFSRDSEISECNRKPQNTQRIIENVPAPSITHRAHRHWQSCFLRRLISFISWSVNSIMGLNANWPLLCDWP